MNNTLGLYIHIPFCAKKCAYCDFYSLTESSKQLMNDYIDAVIRHMKEAAEYTGKTASLKKAKLAYMAQRSDFVVDSIYFGGGTPSLLGVPRLKKLLSAIFKFWEVSNNAEITFEGNPESLEQKSLKKLKKAGFNRISIGVQAVQPELLEVLGRIHTVEQAADSVRAAQNAGFDNVSVDIMYGLPKQTAQMLADTVTSVASWGVQHISMYGLKLEENTPLYNARPVLPDDDEQMLMYLDMVELLRQKGYEQYEISNFAQPSRFSRHNMKYWILEPYIGFGAAAHSDFGGKRYGHVRSVSEYIEGVLKKDSVIAEMEEISPIERAGEYVMLGLRTARGISGNEYTRRYKVNFDILEKKLERLKKYELAVQEGDRWRLTAKGFLVSNRILTELLESPVTQTPAML